jgi:predicted DNA-binding WGR domain protein
MPRLTCTEGGASKFWEGTVEGCTLRVHFGKLGSNGQVKLKELATPAAAVAELAKLVREKRAKQR